MTASGPAMCLAGLGGPPSDHDASCALNEEGSCLCGGSLRAPADIFQESKQTIHT